MGLPDSPVWRAENSQQPPSHLCGIESFSSMFSATDIASFLACRHTATLARAESRDEIAKPFFKNGAIDLLRTLGFEHERRYLWELSAKDGLSITQIAIGGSWKDAVAETIEALRQGVDAVYQTSGLGPTRLWKPSSPAPPKQQR